MTGAACGAVLQVHLEQPIRHQLREVPLRCRSTEADGVSHLCCGWWLLRLPNVLEHEQHRGQHCCTPRLAAAAGLAEQPVDVRLRRLGQATERLAQLLVAGEAVG